MERKVFLQKKFKKKLPSTILTARGHFRYSKMLENGVENALWCTSFSSIVFVIIL